jgi:uncharacterized membrane protein
MTPRFVGTLILVIIVACFVAGILVYPYLPAMMASHWSAHGEVNGMMGKFWGAFTIPIIMLVLMGLWALLPHIDPVAPGFKGFRYVYDFVFFLAVAFLAYAYALMLGVNAGLRFDMFTMLLPALAVLIFLFGALLPHLKRNWFIGIRTPWTISNNVVWDKTHRLGSILFEMAGVCILAAAFVPRAATLWLILVPIILAAVVSVVYSYLIYRRQGGRTS